MSAVLHTLSQNLTGPLTETQTELGATFTAEHNGLTVQMTVQGAYVAVEVLDTFYALHIVEFADVSIADAEDLLDAWDAALVVAAQATAYALTA